MDATKRVRVAAVQFAVGTDINANLKTALRMLDEAARNKPDLVVLPEFSNHLSWYDDGAHCHQVSVSLEGPWLSAIAEKAREHAMYVVVNCTVRREGGTATGTSVLFDRRGQRLQDSDKQVLIGHENQFLQRATRNCPVVETEIGRLGMYACMDGVIQETPRSLSLRGAQILCNSLNSFAVDEASLHIPVRAAENRVFVVAANKVGPLIPAELMGPVSAQTSIPERFLHGAGESQIVSPDGSVLAKAPREGEAVVFADIQPKQADNKRRPDGTDVFRARRPALYRALADAPQPLSASTPGASEMQAAVYQPEQQGEKAIEEACGAVEEAGASGVQLLALPEMFCFPDGVTQDPTAALAVSTQAVQALTEACRKAGPIAVTTSLVTEQNGERRHTGLLIDGEGIRLAQGALHASQRHPWSALADHVEVLALPFARTALIVGDDALYPESFRLAVLAGAELVAVPFHAQEAWEVSTGLLERSAENRLCVVAATRPSDMGESLLLSLWKDFTLMTPWESRPFDGHLSHPRVTRATREPGCTRAALHPACAENKVVSLGTHLVDGRPWQLSGDLVATGKR